jgi:hypothetical protein
LKREHYNRSSDEESSEKSIEFIPDPKVSAQVNQHKQKQRKQKTDERKEAFQRSKAGTWIECKIKSDKRGKKKQR